MVRQGIQTNRTEAPCLIIRRNRQATGLFHAPARTFRLT
ncbi:hypothetical protein SXCC_00804 [Gluconacetobacter sp. SXCC-1]|nr:hypothetical protein SXCC_00804 [Gluconacetobacter sp. SXCC-1]